MTRETIALTVTAELQRALAAIAAERGITVHAAARLAVELGVRELTATRQLTLGGGRRG